MINENFFKSDKKSLKYYYEKGAGSKTNIPFPPELPEIENLLYSSGGLNLCPDCKEKKSITFDEDGNYLLNEKEEYENLRKLGGGLILAKKNNLYGIINYKNEEIIPLDYDELKIKSNYCIIAWKNKKCGVFDFRGKYLLPLKFDDIKIRTIFDYSKDENLLSQFIVIRDELYGVYDEKGKIVIPIIYASLELFHSKFYKAKKVYKAKKNEYFGIIATNGEILSDFMYKEINLEDRNLFMLFDTIDKEGHKKIMTIINQNGIPVIKKIKVE